MRKRRSLGDFVGSRRSLLAATWLTLGLFVIGVVAPTFEIVPGFGGPITEAFVKIFGWYGGRHVYSILSGIIALFEDGNYALALAILFFSVLFPGVKLATILMLAHREAALSGKALTAVRYLHTIGHWSMVDVYVIAVLAVSMKALPRGTHIDARWGLFVFGASVICSVFCARWAGYLQATTVTAPGASYD